VKQLATILFLFTCFSLFAQRGSEENQKKKVELGINVTNIISSALVNDANTEQREYPFTLKLVGDKRVWRFGLDASFNNGDDFPIESKTLFVGARAGLEKRKHLADRWIFLYGIDAIFRHNFERTINQANIERITLTDKGWGLGLSPLIGFQFQLSEHIALEIESSIVFTTTRETSELIFDQSLPLNTYDEAFTYDLRLIDPRFLYLIVKF